VAKSEKEVALQKYYDIVLATINFNISVNTGHFVSDGEDIALLCYNDQKITAEKYFKGRNLEMLKQKFSFFTKNIQSGDYKNYSKYIKEKTGYDIDLLADLHKRIEIILLQNEIKTKKEENDVGDLLHYYDENSISGEKVEKLRTLLDDYWTIMSEKSSNRYQTTEIISIEEKDGVELITEEITFGTYPKNHNYKDSWITSPNKKCKAFIQWNDSKHPVTSVSLQFHSGASGPIYAVEGIWEDITVSWKDDTTLVIRTKKNLKVFDQSKEVRSRDMIIHIEYLED